MAVLIEMMLPTLGLTEVASSRKAWATCRAELFVPIVEARPREHLRDDKLQRDWGWSQQDRR